MDQLPRLGKRELICLLLFTCNYVVFVWISFLFLWVLGMDYVILLWHSLSLPYNYLLLFFKKLRLLGLKISHVNRSILVFKFWAIKSGVTLSCLSIDICTVTCGRQVGISIVTRDYLRIVTRIALFCIKLS